MEPFRLLIHGSEGVEKSTFASNVPDPVFIQTEGGLAQIDVPKFPLAESFEGRQEPIPNGTYKADAVISDPPFGITACDWDIALPFDHFWKVVGRVDTTLDRHFHSGMLLSWNGHKNTSNGYNTCFPNNEVMSKSTTCSSFKHCTTSQKMDAPGEHCLKDSLNGIVSIAVFVTGLIAAFSTASKTSQVASR